MPEKFQPISKIPRNDNSIQNGFTDPEPEKGEDGSFRRSFWSWIKGWGTPKKESK